MAIVVVVHIVEVEVIRIVVPTVELKTHRIIEHIKIKFKKSNNNRFFLLIVSICANAPFSFAWRILFILIVVSCFIQNYNIYIYIYRKIDEELELNANHFLYALWLTNRWRLILNYVSEMSAALQVVLPKRK